MITIYFFLKVISSIAYVIAAINVVLPFFFNTKLNQKTQHVVPCAEYFFPV